MFQGNLSRHRQAPEEEKMCLLPAVLQDGGRPGSRVGHGCGLAYTFAGCMAQLPIACVQHAAVCCRQVSSALAVAYVDHARQHAALILLRCLTVFYTCKAVAAHCVFTSWMGWRQLIPSCAPCKAVSLPIHLQPGCKLRMQQHQVLWRPKSVNSIDRTLLDLFSAG